MKFQIYKTSDWYCTDNKPWENAYIEGEYWHVDINTLEELMEIRDKYKEEIVIGYDKHFGNYIEIYDTYRE